MKIVVSVLIVYKLHLIKKLETLGDLGERMSLIHEYGRNKENKIIESLLMSGMTAEVVSKSTKIPLSRVKTIEKN